MKQATPPKFARKFLIWFLRNDLVEEVLGDLDEQFNSRCKGSVSKARVNYFFQVLNYLRPFAIKGFSANFLYQGIYWNFVKTGWRQLIRQKLLSLVKIGGLATGIGACLLILLVIIQELSHDSYYKNKDRIYRVVRVNDSDQRRGVFFPAPLASALKEEYPEIHLAGRYNPAELYGAGSNEVRRADKSESFHEENIVFVDQSLLDILQVQFLQGDVHHALDQPNTIVITEQKARKYFPNGNAIGNVLIFNNDDARQYVITGVILNFPVASHLQFDFLISLANHEFFEGENTNWRNSNYITYISVNEGTNVPLLESKLNSVIDKYFLPSAVEAGDANEIAWVKNLRFELQPVSDIYLNRNKIDDFLKHGDIQYIWFFGALAVFILLIACVNFINLSTAGSTVRAREIGLRKTFGSQPGSLVQQFLTEAAVYGLFSFVLGLALSWLVMPYFNSLLLKPVSLTWDPWWFYPVFFCCSIVVSLTAGLYPAFYLSTLQPVGLLKKYSRKIRSLTIRSILVIFQFSISFILISATITIFRQMNYSLTKKTGFDKNNVLILESTHTLGDKAPFFKSELLKIPGVKYATISGFVPLEGAKRSGSSFINKSESDEKIFCQQWLVDSDYIKTLGIKIINGRDFSAELPTDSQAVIINQEMAKALHLGDPVGKIISNNQKNYTVIGEIENFNYESLRTKIEPLCLVLGRNQNNIIIKAGSSDMQDIVASVTNLWKEFSPNQTIRYSFLESKYATMYKDLERTGRIFTGFTLLAVIIACLGLFALSAFITEQRMKEINIRLILGASFKSIFALLNRYIAFLVLVSAIIATPISWYVMNYWLKNFAYHIRITWYTFLISGMTMILMVLLTNSYQTIKSAFLNPVDHLKTE